MKLKIFDNGIESEISFNSISNGQTTKTDPNSIVFPEVWNDDIAIKRQIDQVLKEVNLPRRTLDKNPNTTWPSHDVNPEKWSPMDTKSFKNLFEHDFNYHYDRGIQDIPKHDTRFDNFDFKQYMPTPAPPSARVGALAFRALGGAVGGILVLILLASVCKQKGSRRGVVLTPRAAAGAGTVQPDTETHRRPSGQGGFPPQLVICQPSDPPSFDLPPSYSECITKNVSKPPPHPNPAETAPLVHNGLVDIGFRNDCVDMTTSPEGVKTELVFDNGRIVERLSLDLSKETGQGIKYADVKDRVVYVDENSKA